MPFGSVSQQALKPAKTVELVLNQLVILGEHPILVVQHLGESNKPFWNDALAKASANAADRGRNKKITPAEIDAGRAANRTTVAKFAVVDTRGFFHDYTDRPGFPDHMKPATKADIPEIINALPNEVFDSVMSFVLNAENFRDHDGAFADPEALAKK